MIRPLIEGAPKVIPMLCGTKGFVRPLRAYFVEAGYDRKEVKTETYDYVRLDSPRLMAFLHEILVDRRNLDNDVLRPIRHTLATKP